MPNLIKRPDGSYDADARAPIEQLEKIVGAVLADEEQEDIDTLGDLIFALTRRVRCVNSSARPVSSSRSSRPIPAASSNCE